MAAKKPAKTSVAHSALVVRLRGLAAWARDGGRTWTLAGLTVIVLAGLWVGAWLHYRDRVLGSRPYLVRTEDLNLTPLPSWIQTDLRAEAYRDLCVAGPVSIMDDDLNERVAQAFSLQPWVARVVRVRKFHPARVDVDLEYRRPVCMVEVRDVVENSTRLLPIDSQGVFLPPADFRSMEKRIEASTLYPRLSGVEDTYPLALGDRWPDQRVVGGAQVAAAFGPTWLRLGLTRIVPETRNDAGASPTEPTFALITRGQTKILWGHRPGAEASGELRAAKKIALLEQFAARHGTLDPPGGPATLDVRNAASIEMALRRGEASR